jgi:hypothetical protein
MSIDELLAADARGKVVVAQVGAQHAGNPAQDFVACGVG